MSVRATLGLDWFDVVLHVVISAIVTAGVVAGFTDKHESAVAGSLAAGGSLVLLGIRRHFALRRGGRGPGGFRNDPAPDELTGQLLGELEEVRSRMQELEERVDFSERLLAGIPKEPSREQSRL